MSVSVEAKLFFLFITSVEFYLTSSRDGILMFLFFAPVLKDCSQFQTNLI